MNLNLYCTLAIVCLLGPGYGGSLPVSAQDPHADSKTIETDPLLAGMQYRLIGPFRGGRSAAVCGDPRNPLRFLMGGTGGGVWETTDGGNSWRNISDGFFGGSIGAVALADSDPNVIYVGGGEVTVRGNVSSGYGMWRSDDGGGTWKAIGLEDSRHIPRIRVHPKDADLVYVAALGHLYGPNEQRGVFRSRDGGKNWERVLFVSDEVGACDLVLDPVNPRILYASTWRVKRTPYSLESGGEGSGLWKSTDGGDTWTEITRNSGLPQGTVGIIGVAVSPLDSNRVWAIVEAADGGLFRSENAGKTWSRINEDRSLRQRAWYYTRVYAGTKNRDEVYVLNVSFHRSRDGGKTFSDIDTPHGDHHDLWIDPANDQRMVIADDGGAQVSYNAGATWSTYENQPTAQFYRVVTDNHYPYRIYGAQQDNSTVRIASRSLSFAIGEDDWEPTAGGESGHIAPDPDDPEIVYGGSYGGDLTRIDHRTRQSRSIDVWPDNAIGRGAGELKYRFQWNFPIVFSPHQPKTLYTAANVLFKSTDEGHSWTAISPDLTRNDPSKLGPSGGPITKDNTGVEVYCTIFAVAESTHEPGVIWTGSDDGLIQVTRDGGQNWENVTPPELPEWSMINSIDIDPFEKGGVYVAATRYKLDDFKPYLLHTTDYGKTWRMITSGIDPKHFTRVVRADPGRAGLLYAGSESGLYISLDNGANWESFQMNLPIVPITDLAVKQGDLIVATQGRSFWILDELTRLHQFDPAHKSKGVHMYTNRPVERLPGAPPSAPAAGTSRGRNPNAGGTVRFWLRDQPAEEVAASLEILAANGQPAIVFKRKPDTARGERDLSLAAGLNAVSWDLRYPGAETFDGMVLWGGGTQGPLAPPGNYQVRLTLGDQVLESPLEIRKDPRLATPDDAYQQQFDFLLSIRDKLTEVHRAIKQIRDIRSQITGFNARIGDHESYKPLVEAGNKLVESLSTIEKALYQTESKSSQDPLNFPIRLNNRLSYLANIASSGPYPPTAQVVQLRNELVAEIDGHLAQMRQLIGGDLKSLNDQIRAAAVPPIFSEPAK